MTGAYFNIGLSGPCRRVAAAPARTERDSVGQSSPSDDAARIAKGRAAMLNWVRQGVNAYIEASATGFESYKRGEAITSAGLRMWDSSVAPVIAKGCWVIQGEAGSTLSGLLNTQTDLIAVRSYYTQLTEGVTASLPQDWKAEAAPPFGGDLPSKGFHPVDRAGTSGLANPRLAQHRNCIWSLSPRVLSIGNSATPPNR